MSQKNLPTRKAAKKNAYMTWCLLAFTTLFPAGQTYSSGAPPGLCDREDPMPGHGTSEDSSLPFYLNVSEPDNQNATVVTILASDGPYKGFFLRAMPLDPNATLQGEFASITVGAKLLCDNQGVTQNSSDDKTEMSFTWQPDRGFQDDVYFIGAVVTRREDSWKRITNRPPFPEATTTHLPPSSITQDAECGITKGCYSECTGNTCSYLITWQPFNQYVTFTMYADLNVVRTFNDKYNAIAFSSDMSMGDDSVLACKLSGSVVEVETGLTSGKIYTTDTTGSVCVSNVTGRVNDAVLTCAFNRDVNCSNPQTFDLTRSWHLLQASGDVSGGVLQRHSHRSFSASPVNFLSVQIVQAEEPNNTLIKVHGSLMIIAWILFSSIGIVTARYFKQEWKEKKIGGQKIWFQIHRACMLTVLICTVTSFIIIFVHVGGYSKIAVSGDDEYLKAHPILGIIVMALTVINPILSIFRCEPTDSRRQYFNIPHYVIGTGAHIVSAITITFGMNLEESGTAVEAIYIMYAYAGTFVLINIILEVWRCFEKSTDDKNSTIELRDINSRETINIKPIEFEMKKNIQKRFILCIHVILMLSFTVALVVLVVKD